jgi:hypothetical protein
MVKKRGQITIFIILGIMILGILFLLISFFSKDQGVNVIPFNRDGAAKTNSQIFIEDCLDPQIANLSSIISAQGGYLYDKKPSLEYKFHKVSYLCHSGEYYTNCENLNPMIIHEVEEQLEETLLPFAEKCFENLLILYSEYSIDQEPASLSIRLYPGVISFDLKKDISVIEDPSVQMNDFSFNYESPLHTSLSIATKVSNVESSCDCSAVDCMEEKLGIDEFHKEFVITRYIDPKGESVYTIKYSTTGENFNFAVRNCMVSYE